MGARALLTNLSCAHAMMHWRSARSCFNCGSRPLSVTKLGGLRKGFCPLQRSLSSDDRLAKLEIGWQLSGLLRRLTQGVTIPRGSSEKDRGGRVSGAMPKTIGSASASKNRSASARSLSLSNDHPDGLLTLLWPFVRSSVMKQGSGQRV